MRNQFFVGLDLGQAQDFTAAAILERPDPRERVYAARHLQRWPLGTSYPEIVADVVQMVRRLTPAPILAVDATGVGRPVVESVATSPDWLQPLRDHDHRRPFGHAGRGRHPCPEEGAGVGIASPAPVQTARDRTQPAGCQNPHH